MSSAEILREGVQERRDFPDAEYLEFGWGSGIFTRRWTLSFGKLKAL